MLSTVDPDGRPNAIYVGCVNVYSDDTVVVADNYFCKTRANIRAGSPAAILFITSDGKPYQIKGAVEYHTDGPVFEAMKEWNPKKHPGHAAAAIKVEEVYSGAEKLA
ncbi:MAG: pyridoxamine 5'-phosphate oxidase family protein [Planctomycetota bacterium]